MPSAPPPEATRGSVFFYAGWPLGYHNREAERKARAFARSGRDVVWTTSIGFRNPRAASAGKLVDRVRRKVARPGPRAVRQPDPEIRTAAVLVAPPRHLAPVRRANVAWIERQLRAAVADWTATVAWIRNVTPELVAALPRLSPAAVVFEAVDAYHLTPGVTGRWISIFERAERDLVDLADRVVVSNGSLAERYEHWGADVRHVPHGVELFPWRLREPQAGRPVTLGFLGVLDMRLDAGVVRHVAQARPDWRVRLIGPVEPGFDPGVLADLDNVRIEPPVPHERVGEHLAQFDLGFLAYADIPVYRHMSPLKNLELLAAGRPVVARPTVELERYGGVTYFARTPEEFLAQAERALAEDGPERARWRRAIAEASSWEPRLAELVGILDEVAPPARGVGDGAPGRAEVATAAQEPHAPREVHDGEDDR